MSPPYVPGAPREQPAEPMPVVRSFDSAPVEEMIVQEMPEPPAAQPPMPWETPLSNSEEFSGSPDSAIPSGPLVTAETGETAPRDLDDWEEGIDPEGGQAVPAYGDEESVEDAAFSSPPQVDEEGVVIGEPERADRLFPLDAFFIPPDTKRLPKGLEHAEVLHLEVAEALAKRLESVAQRLRREGFAGLLHVEPGQEPIDTLIAGVLAGYLSNQAEG